MNKRSKKHACGLAIAVIAIIAASWWFWGRTETIPTASTGLLERFTDFDSEFVNPRTISVWLPAGSHTGDSCAVLYMHDGQMLFDATTTWNGQEWQVDEIAGQLIGDSLMRRCIVVGIDNTDRRLQEYFPTKAWQQLPHDKQGEADTDKLLGDDYLKFIVTEVKPFIDKCYKPLTSREHTFMMGSSMGGLISLYALCEYPQVFGGVACLSTHLSFKSVGDGVDGTLWSEAFCRYLSTHLPSANSRLVYMDRGTEGIDASYAPHQQQVDSVFAAHGWDSEHYVSHVFDGHEHKEIFWAKRLEKPLLFLLGQ